MKQMGSMLKEVASDSAGIQGIYAVIDPELTGQVFESWFLRILPRVKALKLIDARSSESADFKAWQVKKNLFWCILNVTKGYRYEYQ